MIRVGLALALALPIAPDMASALSCMRLNFATEFNRIAAAPELYSIVYGEFREAGAVPTYVPGTPRSVVYEFTGQVFHQGRHTQSREVQVETGCAGSFCGPLPAEDTPIIAFLRHDPGGFTLVSEACPTDFLPRPSLGQVMAIRVCLQTSLCGPAEIAAFE